MNLHPLHTHRPLSLIERRVLGVLVEKQKTTDTYPLTLNSLTVGCNQKSNRHPVLDLSEEQVVQALESLQRDGLVIPVSGGRVDKWKHRLYDAWGVSSEELAILAELLLRGPQTEGELRIHTSRMEPIADLDTLRSHLSAMDQRGLVVYLTEPGRRGMVVTHGFHDADELQQIRTRQGLEAVAVTAAGAAPAPADASTLTDLKNEVNQLRAEVAQLQAQIQQILEKLDARQG